MNNQSPVLRVDRLTAGYGDRPVVRDICFSITARQRWAIIGRNGTGKSTLVKCIASLLPLSDGTVTVDSRPLSSFSARERARLISYVPQATERSIPFTVYDYVMLGRHTWQPFLGTVSREDRDAVERALELTDLSRLTSRTVATLSGGEAQRVFLAGAVAQHAPIMLLDEPTVFLDPAHEAQFYTILDRIHDEYNLTVVAVTHDVNAALNRYTHVLALKDGMVFFEGRVSAFMKKTPGVLEDIYGIRFRRYEAAEDGLTVFGAWGCA